MVENKENWDDLDIDTMVFIVFSNQDE